MDQLPQVSVEEDAPPLTRGLASELRRRLGDPDFATATGACAGVAAVRSASTPQAVTFRVADGSVAVSHGAAGNADVTVTVDLDDDQAEPEIEADEAHADLRDWVLSLLDPPRPPWPEAAERFWATASKLPGAPAGLRIVELDSGEERRFGENGSRAYEIHGSAEPLVRVLTAQQPLIEAAHRGRVFVLGSFSELSVLTGAGFALAFGAELDA
jgi:hypothetical protein